MPGGVHSGLQGKRRSPACRPDMQAKAEEGKEVSRGTGSGREMGRASAGSYGRGGEGGERDGETRCEGGEGDVRGDGEI